VLVVVTGWMPHFVTDSHMTMDGPERAVFGLLGMSILDVTAASSTSSAAALAA
jgi:hypothetical protein